MPAQSRFARVQGHRAKKISLAVTSSCKGTQEDCHIFTAGDSCWFELRKQKRDFIMRGRSIFLSVPKINHVGDSKSSVSHDPRSQVCLTHENYHVWFQDRSGAVNVSTCIRLKKP